MLKNILKITIYLALTSFTTLALAKDIVCQGPDISTVVYQYKGVTKLILKRGNALPLSARCHGIETGELECFESVSGEQLFFRMNPQTREARIELGAIKVYGLKCPLPQKKDAPTPQRPKP